MADVKWIKITTNVFDDEKIQLIESMPDSDTIIVIWFKLLALAGKSNNGGLVLFNEKIPYTKEMLYTLFRRKKTTVDLALETFQSFGMIEVLDNETIFISNWEKHQQIDKLEQIRLGQRDRQKTYREKQKKVMLALCNGNTLDKEEEKEKDIIPIKAIVDFLNSTIDGSYKHTTNKTRDLIKARWNEGFRLEDFKQAILNAWKHWGVDGKTNMKPSTLFNGSFEGRVTGDSYGWKKEEPKIIPYNYGDVDEGKTEIPESEMLKVMTQEEVDKLKGRT